MFHHISDHFKENYNEVGDILKWIPRIRLEPLYSIEELVLMGFKAGIMAQYYLYFIMIIMIILWCYALSSFNLIHFIRTK